jgi:hypothetical protein
MVIVQMVVGCVFDVNVESFDSVYMHSFLLVMYHLRDVVDGAKECALSWRYCAKFKVWLL